MKIKFKHSDFSRLSLVQFMRQAGYHSLPERNNSQLSFVRRLGQDFYPRFHLYPIVKQEEIILNLHLDQKKASYAKQVAHSGEYDGQLVEAEANRLWSLLKSS